MQKDSAGPSVSGDPTSVSQAILVQFPQAFPRNKYRKSQPRLKILEVQGWGA